MINKFISVTYKDQQPFLSAGIEIKQFLYQKKEGQFFPRYFLAHLPN